MRKLFGILSWGAATALAFAAWGAGAQDAPAEAPESALLKAMFRLDVAAQVALQAGRIAESCAEDVAAEVVAAGKAYQVRESAAIRSALEDRFGDEAREVFGGFVDAFAKASADGDAAFLAKLAESVGGWDEAPADYAALRSGMVQRVLREEIAAAGRFLADVQTWVDLKGKAENVPSLAAWVDRAAPVGTTTRQVVKRPKPAKRNPLRDSEAQAETFEAEDGGGSSSALGGFGAARKERREKALQDAQAGMQQVAEERRAAEEEFAAKKTAAAQAEADAVRKQAEKLAAAESEAIEQRKNSWSGRLKSVLTATIGATSGAFLGNVGGRAGEAAANAIFNEDGGHGRGRGHGD